MSRQNYTRAPLIELRGASLIYGRQKVLDSISWRLMPGEHWAVIGHNGAGKSSFLKMLRGEIRPHLHGAEAPAITWAFEGEPDSSPLAVRPLSSMLSAELQRHYMRAAWQISGEEVILSGFGDGYMLYDRPSDAERAAAHAIASRLGAAQLLQVQAPDMSQGQLRLILLARALVKKPRLLLLDEPCDGLDAAGQKIMLDLLEEICGETSIICAIHKGEDIPACLTHVLELKRGRISASGPLNRKKIFTKQNFPASLPTPAEPGAKAQQGTVFKLEKADVYLKRKKILHGLNWQVKSGENWLVSGPNGSGKSTLLRLLLGEEHVALGGSLHWFLNGAETEGPVTLEERRRYTGYVSDYLHSSYGYDLSGRDIVLSGLMGSIGFYRAPTPQEEQETDYWLDLLGLRPLAHKKLEAMSEGVARRFLLARALAPRPKLLILDEACSGLDGEGRWEFMQQIPLALEQGSQLIFVSHSQSDLAQIKPLLTHELRLKEGRIEYCGVYKG